MYNCASGYVVTVHACATYRQDMFEDEPGICMEGESFVNSSVPSVIHNSLGFITSGTYK